MHEEHREAATLSQFERFAGTMKEAGCVPVVTIGMPVLRQDASVWCIAVDETFNDEQLCDLLSSLARSILAGRCRVQRSDDAT